MSEKTVVLAGVPTGMTQKEIAESLKNLLLQPIVVRDKSETVFDRGIFRCIIPYGTFRLEDDRIGYIFSICYLGTPVCGMYFFKEGDNFLTEMVDPDRHNVSQVVRDVTGERI